jgi:DNA-binding NtrC family response regulator
VADRVTRKPAAKKILVVDDDVKIRSLLREILSVLPHQVLEAEDGQQALEIIHQETIDLIITDRSMQRMDGLELLKKLHEEKATIPTLMISAYGDEDLWASAVGLGAEDYILKPFSSESVMKIVKRKLG